MNPRFLALLCMLAAALPVGVDAAGVVITKEQDYHRDESARAIAYRSMLASQGPYLRLLSAEGRVIEIRRSKVVAQLDLLEKIPATLLSEEDLRPLREMDKSVAEFRSRYPASAPLLEAYADSLAAHIARYGQEWVRFEERWMTRAEHAGLAESRLFEAASERLSEIEQRIADAAQREQGRVLQDGKWISPEEAARRPGDASTELSIAISPLRSGDLEGAKRAVENLATLAAGQHGAVKVRTERLKTAVRNLYAAETRHGQRLLVAAGELRQATEHERNAKEWLVPNRFGRVNPEASAASRRQARDIRQRVQQEIADCREELRGQVREIERVREDFALLREERVAEVLEIAAGAVSDRNFSGDGSSPAWNSPS